MYDSCCRLYYCSYLREATISDRALCMVDINGCGEPLRRLTKDGGALYAVTIIRLLQCSPAGVAAALLYRQHRDLLSHHIEIP
jgi:hypothetical protein